MAEGAIFVETPTTSTEIAQSRLPTKFKSNKMAPVTDTAGENEGVEPTGLNLRGSDIMEEGANEEETQLPTQNELFELTKTSEQKGDVIEETQEKEEEASKSQISKYKTQPTKKRAALSPLTKEKEKKERITQFSDSSSSDDLNRLFPQFSANEISFLAVELKTSTHRATFVSSEGSHPPTPESFTLGIKEGPDLQEIEELDD